MQEEMKAMAEVHRGKIFEPMRDIFRGISQFSPPQYAEGLVFDGKN